MKKGRLVAGTMYVDLTAVAANNKGCRRYTLPLMHALVHEDASLHPAFSARHHPSVLAARTGTYLQFSRPSHNAAKCRLSPAASFLAFLIVTRSPATASAAVTAAALDTAAVPCYCSYPFCNRRILLSPGIASAAASAAALANAATSVAAAESPKLKLQLQLQ